MPQTLLGLLALSLATLLSFSQQRVTIQSYEVRLRDEYSVAASGLLTQIMELIAARSFDEASTPDWIDDKQRLPTVADFTLPVNFGGWTNEMPNGHAYGLRRRAENFTCSLMEPHTTPHCTDVDDFDRIEWQAVYLELGNGRRLNFEVSIIVEYVDDQDPTQIVNVPTHSKMVRVRARVPERPQLGELVRLERVIAYDPMKAETEHEMQHGPLTGS